jgi:hypothetical protein
LSASRDERASASPCPCCQCFQPCVRGTQSRPERVARMCGRAGRPVPGTWPGYRNRAGRCVVSRPFAHAHHSPMLAGQHRPGGLQAGAPSAVFSRYHPWLHELEGVLLMHRSAISGSGSTRLVVPLEKRRERAGYSVAGIPQRRDCSTALDHCTILHLEPNL